MFANFLFWVLAYRRRIIYFLGFWDWWTLTAWRLFSHSLFFTYWLFCCTCRSIFWRDERILSNTSSLGFSLVTGAFSLFLFLRCGRCLLLAFLFFSFFFLRLVAFVHTPGEIKEAGELHLNLFLHQLKRQQLLINRDVAYYVYVFLC